MVLSRQDQKRGLSPIRGGGLTTSLPGMGCLSAQGVAPGGLNSHGHWAGLQTPVIRALTLIWKEVVIMPSTLQDSFLSHPHQLILKKCFCNWADTFLFFWKQWLKKQTPLQPFIPFISKAECMKHSGWLPSQFQAITGPYFNTHTHTLDALHQGSYRFCTLLSLHYHCLALVSAVSARETPPIQRCYHLLFFRIST